jgi:exonuclease VII small subunit
MHDTQDVRKSKELHDKEMLIDELEHRVQKLEERLNSLEYNFNMHQEGMNE